MLVIILHFPYLWWCKFIFVLLDSKTGKADRISVIFFEWKILAGVPCLARRWSSGCSIWSTERNGWLLWPSLWSPSQKAKLKTPVSACLVLVLPWSTILSSVQDEGEHVWSLLGRERCAWGMEIDCLLIERAVLLIFCNRILYVAQLPLLQLVVVKEVFPIMYRGTLQLEWLWFSFTGWTMYLHSRLAYEGIKNSWHVCLYMHYHYVEFLNFDRGFLWTFDFLTCMWITVYPSQQNSCNCVSKIWESPIAQQLHCKVTCRRVAQVCSHKLPQLFSTLQSLHKK